MIGERLLTLQINELLNGDFQNTNPKAMTDSTNIFRFGKITIQNNPNKNKPTKSDNLPVIQLENAYLK